MASNPLSDVTAARETAVGLIAPHEGEMDDRRSAIEAFHDRLGNLTHRMQVTFAPEKNQIWSDAVMEASRAAADQHDAGSASTVAARTTAPVETLTHTPVEAKIADAVPDRPRGGPTRVRGDDHKV